MIQAISCNHGRVAPALNASALQTILNAAAASSKGVSGSPFSPHRPGGKPAAQMASRCCSLVAILAAFGRTRTTRGFQASIASRSNCASDVSVSR